MAPQDSDLIDTSQLRKLVRSKKKRVKHAVNNPTPIPVITLSDDDEPKRQNGHEEMDTAESVDNSIDRSRSTSAARSISPSDERDHKAVRCTDADAALEAMRNLSIEKPWDVVRKWKKTVEKKEESRDPNDEAIDIFVRDYEDKPNEYWLLVADEMERKNIGYEFDYIVAAEPRLKPEEALMKNRWVLIKWANFAVPTWGRVASINTQRGKSDQVRQMDDRLSMLHRLEQKLRSERRDFDRKYPHRWLPCVEDKGEYVQNERALYENRLRASEWRMNFEYEKAHEEKLKKFGAACKDPAPAPVYLINWVDDSRVPIVDKESSFKFVTKMQPTPRVATILANTQEMDWLKCTECSLSCTYPREHFHMMKSCCGVSYGAVHHYGDRHRLVGRWEEPEEGRTEGTDDQEPDVITPGHLTVQEIESGVIVECSDACVCKGMCKQRVIQRGRQIPLIIFREDEVKGWGLRAGADIHRGEYVTEYIGEVLTAKEQADHHAGSHYMLDMRVGWSENLTTTDRVRGESKPERRNHKPFSVDATNMGNEARYINHSCEPNLVAVVAYVERHGEFYHRIAYFARRNIPFGEELTFDYFPAKENIEAWKKMFTKCRCGSMMCKFKGDEDDKRKAEEVMEDEEEEEDDDDDDWKSVDSFLSDDDEFRKQCMEIDEKKKKVAEKEREKRRRNGVPVHSDDEDDDKPGSHLAHLDMTRNPYDLILERLGGNEEEAKKIMEERRNGRPGKPKGILHLFGPWCPEKQQKMFEEARILKARRATNRRLAEEAVDRELVLKKEKRRIEEEKRKAKEAKFRRKRPSTLN